MFASIFQLFEGDHSNGQLTREYSRQSNPPPTKNHRLVRLPLSDPATVFTPQHRQSSGRFTKLESEAEEGDEVIVVRRPNKGKRRSSTVSDSDSIDTPRKRVGVAPPLPVFDASPALIFAVNNPATVHRAASTSWAFDSSSSARRQFPSFSTPFSPFSARPAIQQISTVMETLTAPLPVASTTTTADRPRIKSTPKSTGDARSACHYDKIRTTRLKMSCTSPGCTLLFCETCMKRHFSKLIPAGFVVDATFLCPVCSNTCTCAICRRKNGLEKPDFRTPALRSKPISPESTPLPSRAKLSRSTPSLFASISTPKSKKKRQGMSRQSQESSKEKKLVIGQVNESILVVTEVKPPLSDSDALEIEGLDSKGPEDSIPEWNGEHESNSNNHDDGDEDDDEDKEELNWNDRNQEQVLVEPNSPGREIKKAFVARIQVGDITTSSVSPTSGRRTDGVIWYEGPNRRTRRKLGLDQFEREHNVSKNTLEDEPFDFLSDATSPPSTRLFLDEAMALDFPSPSGSIAATSVATNSPMLPPSFQTAPIPFPVLQELSHRLELNQPILNLDPTDSSDACLNQQSDPCEEDGGEWWDQAKPSPCRTTPIIPSSYLTLSPLSSSSSSTGTTSSPIPIPMPLKKMKFSEMMKSHSNEELGSVLRSMIFEQESSASAHECLASGLLGIAGKYEGTRFTGVPVDYTRIKEVTKEDEEESIFHQLLRASLVDPSYSPSTSASAGIGKAGEDEDMGHPQSTASSSGPASPCSAAPSPLFSPSFSSSSGRSISISSICSDLQQTKD